MSNQNNKNAKYYELQFAVTTRNKARRAARSKRRAELWKSRGATGMNESHKANLAVNHAKRKKNKALRVAAEASEASKKLKA